MEKKSFKVTVQIGSLQADLTTDGGLTVARLKEMIRQEMPDLAAEMDAHPFRVTTMDDTAQEWRDLPGPQEGSLVMRPGPKGSVQILQGVSKQVPDSYVIRPADAFITLGQPEQTETT